jgi:hypothetical protein
LQAYVIRAIMTRITGKETVCLYCVPFGNTPVFQYTEEADDAANKVSRKKRIGITYVPRK